MKTLLHFIAFTTTLAFGQKDTINIVDPFGQRQGNWRLTGAQAPELGVEHTAIAEEGMYFNNQKIGPWVRYDKKGINPMSIVYYRYNEMSNTSLRVAMFPYKYFEDGTKQYVPYPGECSTKANFKRYNPDGTLAEMMEYDSLENEIFSAVQTTSPELDQITYFQVPANFKKTVETSVSVPETNGLKGYSGVYIADFTHTKFISGTFENGKLVDGKECVIDDTYATLSIRIFKNGAYLESYFP